MPSQAAGETHSETDNGAEADEILGGLLASRKSLPCKFFYDEAGSQLFEQITRLDEYYPSRTEKSIMQRNGGVLMRGVAGASLIEIGSGDCSKISLLLQALPARTLETLTYVPVDVSSSAIEESRCKLQGNFAGIHVHGLEADFMQQIDLVLQYEKRIICFFGSTIGNLDRLEALRFVAKLGKLMKTGERLLLGLDMVKDRAVLEKAYNDEKGLTAKFNKNIIKVANKKIQTDFEPEHFRHHAFFDEQKLRIEMHLVATRDMTVKSPLFERDLKIRQAETIHTENSHKFTSDHIGEFAQAGGLSVRAVHTDSQRWFALVDYIK
jgi:L-histidine Nalpha-methyltransferase